MTTHELLAYLAAEGLARGRPQINGLALRHRIGTMRTDRFGCPYRTYTMSDARRMAAIVRATKRRRRRPEPIISTPSA